MTKWKRRSIQVSAALAVLLLLPAALFALNGLVLADRHTPRVTESRA